MQNNKYILFAGPYPPPIHGQSYAFKMAYDHFKEPKILISQNLESSNKLVRTARALRSIINYFLIFNKYDISVVYLTGSRSVLGSLKDVILIRLAKFKNARIINHIHAAHFNKFLESLPSYLKKLYYTSYKKVDVFVPLLLEMVHEYKEFEKSARIEVVENFYDPGMNLLQVPIKSHQSSDSIVISYFSNLIFSKGIFDLLDAFLLLQKKFPAVLLQIAGNYGSDSFMSAEEVKLKFQPYLENKSIEYCGVLQRDAKIKFLTRSHIFILPSFYTSEAFPISILEAMRCGNAIIVSDHHYLPGIVGKEGGSIVEARNINAISDSIETMLEHPEELKTIRSHNVKFASSHYSLDKYINKLYSIIQHTSKF
ncbi:MAG: glycosyltransferase family 4 protein [Saprospiraceae bacterium]|nr:glycosyltransferase family 4 protein [Saprospiraceae bacterium]